MEKAGKPSCLHFGDGAGLVHDAKLVTTLAAKPAAMPKTILVGLPDTAVKESTHRVERAIVNSGFIRPQDRVVINLAPGDLPKQASSFDLLVALGVLAGSGQLSIERLEQYAVVGELAFEGITRPIKGVLSMSIEAANNTNLRGLVVPRANASEAAVVEGLEVIAVDSLARTVAFFAGEIDLFPTPSRIDDLFERFSCYDVEFGDVRGQESAKRAMTLAAAGRHNLIMIGPPNSGETEDIEMGASRRSCRLWHIDLMERLSVRVSRFGARHLLHFAGYSRAGGPVQPLGTAPVPQSLRLSLRTQISEVATRYPGRFDLGHQRSPFLGRPKLPEVIASITFTTGHSMRSVTIGR